MNKGKKLLLILVDPSMIRIEDLISINLPKLKGVRLVRIRASYWGRYKPIQMFYSNSEDITEFLSLEEFKAYFTEVKEEIE